MIDQKTKKEILEKIVHKTNEFYEEEVNKLEEAEAEKVIEEL